MPLRSTRRVTDRLAIKSCLSEYLPALFLLTEQIARRTFGQADLEIRVRFDCVVNDLRAGTRLWASPDGETRSSFCFQNPRCFRTYRFRIRNVEQTEIIQNAVKSCILKRQILSVALQK